ncbi:MAG: hypothetical protein WBE14_28985 [Xanthobacteraceae bacterium]
MTTQDPASAAAPIQGVEYRYRLYELDAQSRSAVPIIAPDLDKAVDAILAVAAQLPHLCETIGENGAVIKKLEMAIWKRCSTATSTTAISNPAAEPSSKRRPSASAPAFAAPRETIRCAAPWTLWRGNKPSKTLPPR